MLFGSLSAANSLPEGLPVTSTFGIVVPSAGLRSSTPAGDCSLDGVVVHPARNAAAAAAVRAAMRTARMTSLLSLGERSPGRLADVACRYGKTLLDTAVGGHGGEHAAAADDGGEEDHAPVGREARRLVAVAVGDDLHLLVAEVEERHLEFAGVARDEGERLAVRAEARRHIIATLEGDPLRLAARRRHAVDLRAAAAVGGEVDPLPVGREARLGVDRGRAGDAAQAAAVRVDEEELRAALARERHREALAV